MDLSGPPKNGDVIHYSYLWRDEDRRGLDEGQKARPAAVLAKKEVGTENTRILVLPITHTPPSEPKIAIEISAQEKRIIGLDHEQQWIICNEINQFYWPGFDVRPILGGSHKYGLMPRGLYDRARALLLKFRTEGRLKAVNRD